MISKSTLNLQLSDRKAMRRFFISVIAATLSMLTLALGLSPASAAINAPALSAADKQSTAVANAYCRYGYWRRPYWRRYGYWHRPYRYYGYYRRPYWRRWYGYRPYRYYGWRRSNWRGYGYRRY
jgi:hypothetical protein